jgi:hypothetical protein
MATNGLRSGVFLLREVTMKPVAARRPGVFVLAAIVIGVASATASADVIRLLHR